MTEGEVVIFETSQHNLGNVLPPQGKCIPGGQNNVSVFIILWCNLQKKLYKEVSPMTQQTVVYMYSG